MSGGDMRMIVIFLALSGGLLFLFRGEVQQFLSTPSKAPARPAAALNPDALQAVYSKLKMEPLSPEITSSQPIARALRELIDAPCDKAAIFKLSTELVKIGERRTASKSLLGFANACPNSEGEINGAASILYGMGDYAAVLPLVDRLIEQRPNAGQYYMMRGEVLNYLGRSREAIEDITSGIALVEDMKRLSIQPFQLLASAYAADGKFCQAMTAIQTYVYADTVARDTASARVLISDYAAKGACNIGYAEGTEVIPRTRQDVTMAKVTINGVRGNFIIDTGASVVTVDADFAERAKITSKNSRKIMTHTANGVTQATLTSAAMVQLGKLRAENVSMAIISKPIGNGIDGLLGMSFLARFDITMSAREVRLQARKQAVSNAN
jgi:aspartyl protease family protein